MLVCLMRLKALPALLSNDEKFTAMGAWLAYYVDLSKIVA